MDFETPISETPEQLVVDFTTTAVSNVLQTALNSSDSNTTAESAWFIKRLVDKFTDAIIEQSNDLTGGTYNRSKSLVSYCISPFAFFCMLTATILNRILIFASSNKKLPTVSRILLRLISIYLLIEGAYGVLVALKGYSYDFSEGGERVENSSSIFFNTVLPSYYNFDFEKFKNYTFLGLYYDVKTYKNIGPTPTIFKAFYLSLCCSQILETFIAVTSGNDPHVESGLTLFEYSLAFQEVQNSRKPSFELLVLSLFALLGHLNIHITGLLNLQKYRLIPSFMVGISSLLYYFKVFMSGRIFHVPFTIIMGFFPQLITLVVILLSLFIYVAAIVFKGGSSSDLLVNSLANINNVTLSDDFYTALSGVGSFMINMTGKKNYIREFKAVKFPLNNYLEASLTNSEQSTIEKRPNGYGVEVSEHPDLAKYHEEIAKNGRTENTWLITLRLRRFKKLMGSFGKLLMSVLFKRAFTNGSPGTINNKSHSSTRFASTRSIHRSRTSGYIEEIQCEVNLDDINDEDELTTALLLEGNLSEIDNSRDFIPTKEFELDEESDEVEEIAMNDNNSMLNELVTTDEFKSLIMPNNLDDIRFNRILNYHMNHTNNEITTRSKFNNYYNEEMKLLDLIREKRSQIEADGSNKEFNCDMEEALGNCVICHVNSRQVILWPCKCLAICENCRMNLFVRNFNDCVCCRGKVEGYSKVYIP